jgi:Flp pilus assembly protein CpaB
VSVRSVLVVLLALVCGGSAAVFVNTWRNSLSAPAAPETVPVVVALVDVERGTTLKAEYFVSGSAVAGPLNRALRRS